MEQDLLPILVHLICTRVPMTGWPCGGESIEKGMLLCSAAGIGTMTHENRTGPA